MQCIKVINHMLDISNISMIDIMYHIHNITANKFTLFVNNLFQDKNLTNEENIFAIYANKYLLKYSDHVHKVPIMDIINLIINNNNNLYSKYMLILNTKDNIYALNVLQQIIIEYIVIINHKYTLNNRFENNLYNLIYNIYSKLKLNKHIINKHIINKHIINKHIINKHITNEYDRYKYAALKIGEIEYFIKSFNKK